MDGTLGACRPDEDAVARVPVALLRPLVRLAVPLPHELPDQCEIRARPERSHGRAFRASVGSDRLDDGIAKPSRGEPDQERAELAIRNVLQGDREGAHARLLRGDMRKRSYVKTRCQEVCYVPRAPETQTEAVEAPKRSSTVTPGLSAWRIQSGSPPGTKRQLGAAHACHLSALRRNRQEPHRRAGQEGRREPRAAPERAAGLQRVLPDRGRQGRHELDRLLRHVRPTPTSPRASPRPGSARRSWRALFRILRRSRTERCSCSGRTTSSPRSADRPQGTGRPRTSRAFPDVQTPPLPMRDQPRRRPGGGRHGRSSSIERASARVRCSRGNARRAIESSRTTAYAGRAVDAKRRRYFRRGDDERYLLAVDEHGRATSAEDRVGGRGR